MISMVYSPEYIKHETGDHPENMERLHVIVESLEKKGILNEINVSKPQIAKYEDILRVHTASYINSLRSFCRKGGGYLDFDTFASPETYKTAKLAAGGAIKASKLVLDGCNVAYSVARPPGHHATQDRAGGFCFFNNLAIALEYLRRVHGLKKFFVFDFDVHYGNGTAETFYEDPDVLYVSIHQDPSTIFPGKGFIEEIGKGAGEGYDLNIPMPPDQGTQITCSCSMASLSLLLVSLERIFTWLMLALMATWTIHSHASNLQTIFIPGLPVKCLILQGPWF